MRRRLFLGLVGGLACGMNSAQGQQAGPTLSGRVLRPGDSDYDSACRLYNPASPVSKPQALVLCSSVEQVQNAIQWGRQQGLPCSIRNGRHSEAGYCQGPGLTVDVSAMQKIEVDTSDRTVLVQGGVQCGALLECLSEHGLALPTGTCLSVGVAGLALGGGFGMASRQLGLTCDNLLEVHMVMADGERTVANATSHPDLWWACKGGGGGQFGVVTAMRFRVHAVPTVSWFHIEWPWEKAAAALAAWQEWAPQAEDGAMSVFLLYAAGQAKSGPVAACQGTWLGPAARLPAQLEPLLSAVPPSRHDSGQETYLANARRWGSTANGKVQPSATRTQFLARPWPRDTVERLLEVLQKRQQSRTMTEYSGIELNAFGGAIARVGGDDSAFAHRAAMALALFESNWHDTDAASAEADNLRWLGDLYDASSADSSGAYVNIQDSRLHNWPQDYFGTHWARLQTVKGRYDPDNRFRFDQSIILL